MDLMGLKMEHSKILSPSSAPALMECNDFESGQGDEFTSKGQLLHEVTEAIFLKKDISKFDVSRTEKELCKVAAKEILQYVEFEIGEDFQFQTEIEVKIFDSEGKEITFGTADFVAWNDQGVVGSDLKSGFNFDLEAIDYKPQQKFYALGTMQKLRITKIKWCEFYIMPSKMKKYDLTYEQCVAGVTAVYQKKMCNPKIPRVCSFCDKCKKIMECKAVNTSLKKLDDQYYEVDVKKDFFTPEEIKDPVVIDDYLLFCDNILKPYIKKLESVMKAVKTQGLKMLESGSLKNYGVMTKRYNTIELDQLEDVPENIMSCIHENVSVSLSGVVESFWLNRKLEGAPLSKKLSKDVVHTALRYAITVDERKQLKRKKVPNYDQK